MSGISITLTTQGRWKNGREMHELIGGHRANYANEDNFNAILAEIEQLGDHDSSHFFAPHYDKATGRTTHEIQVIFEPLKVLKKVEEASKKNIYGSGLNLGLPETSNSLSQRRRIGYRQASMRKMRTFRPARDGGLHI